MYHTIEVIGPPAPIPSGQVTLREAHLLRPRNFPGLEQGFVSQGILQGAQEWRELPVGNACVQFWRTKEGLERQLRGGGTARGGLVLTGEWGV